METIILLLIALALAVDCFAVAVCIGGLKSLKKSNYFIIPLHFGLFQGLMALIGYSLGHNFKNLIEGFDHWVAFLLLAFIGIKLITESLEKSCKNIDKSLTEKEFIILSIATSIDALAVGIALSITEGGILAESLIIGLVSFILAFIGLFVGKLARRFNTKYIGVLGGIVLIGIGIKVLLGHIL